METRRRVVALFRVPRTMARRDILGTTPDQQITDIVLGRLDYSDRKMPSFEGQLKEEQVQAVIAYFRTNWTVQQRAAQLEVTRNWETQQREGSR